VKEGLGRRQEKKGQGWIGMKRKIWSAILTVCMVLGMMPAMSVPVAAGAQIEYYIGETSIGYRNNIEGYKFTASVAGDGWTWTYVAAAMIVKKPARVR
jgi:hypothetical protein